jgi:phosphoenolpyruvate carboxykinase (ATP)
MYNLSREDLISISLSRGEGVLASNGALTVKTGTRTGRSPKDRFIVKDNITQDTVDWNSINQPISSELFNKLWIRVEDYLNNKDFIFISDLYVCTDSKYQIPINIKCELAWHNLFAKNLFIENGTSTQPTWTILSAPNFLTNPERDGVNGDAAIILNFTKRQLLVCGTHYAGEIKKGMFSAMNFIFPPLKVLPIHCSANESKDGTVTLFFGLSGTGKTTLSADPERCLIGDDEHGWSPDEVFNFEGGCYAKCINLSQKNEPLIWNALREGSVMENVVLDSNKNPQYDDESLTQNTRAAYDLSYIENCVTSEKSKLPENVIFLTCDMYGVLPPVSRLNPQQAAYYFLSGYTALVGSTEVGSSEAIKPTFSTCFGAPFFPRRPTEYANLLMEHLNTTKADVYLINTGWTGGPYGKGGKRYSIPTTRSVVSSILNGDLKEAKYKKVPRFNFEIPEGDFYNPITSWSDKEQYLFYTDLLINEFQKNFKKFENKELERAGPV